MSTRVTTGSRGSAVVGDALLADRESNIVAVTVVAIEVARKFRLLQPGPAEWLLTDVMLEPPIISGCRAEPGRNVAAQHVFPRRLILLSLFCGLSGQSYVPSAQMIPADESRARRKVFL
jgi:hypothetical protein